MVQKFLALLHLIPIKTRMDKLSVLWDFHEYYRTQKNGRTIKKL